MTKLMGIGQLDMALEDKFNPVTIIGRSPIFLKALDVARKVAKSSANIFISGESGTGKEIFAKFIHDQSHYKSGPLIAINCSAIPESLLESELFGHCKGAFTGAQMNKIGLFEEAQNGTLFLDEIGDLSLVLQAKLLRVLQEKKIKRVGENIYRTINCRIISATHKNLPLEVNENRFREDLYFRLNVIPIDLPPLRERKEDLILLASSFLRKIAFANSRPAMTFSSDCIRYINENQWRGNVRELENAVERAVALTTGPEVHIESLTSMSNSLNFSGPKKVEKNGDNNFTVNFSNELPSLCEIVNRYIDFAVKKNGGAKDKTAKEIGIDRKTLYKRIRPETGFLTLSN